MTQIIASAGIVLLPTIVASLNIQVANGGISGALIKDYGRARSKKKLQELHQYLSP